MQPTDQPPSPFRHLISIHAYDLLWQQGETNSQPQRPLHLRRYHVHSRRVSLLKRRTRLLLHPLHVRHQHMDHSMRDLLFAARCRQAAPAHLEGSGTSQCLEQGLLTAPKTQLARGKSRKGSLRY